MKEFKPKIKEKWRKDCSIKVETLMDVIENPKSCSENKEKLINITVTKSWCESSSSFKLTKSGKKEALKFIKGELYL